MRRVKFIRAARREVDQAVEYYARIDRAVGLDFANEMDRVIEVLASNPFVGSPYEIEPFRKYVLQQFPYLVFYRVFDDVVYIAAVAHQRRQPHYWIKRQVKE